MAPLHYAAKFDPFLSLDCAWVEGVEERKGRDPILPSGNLAHRRDAEGDMKARLPDGKILSLPFLGLRRGRGRGGAIQGKEGIKFCSVA